MSDEQKIRYEHFRKIRSDLSIKRSVPPYVIFTNEELATLANESELNEETVKHIKGIAPSRLKDSINFFFDDVINDEAGGLLD